MSAAGEDASREHCEQTGEVESGATPNHFEEGFTPRTRIGALFVALIMLPGAIYLGLVSGQSLGAAAEWVTIVLFAEVARRSFMPLKRQEIYVLFYIAAALSGLNAAIGISGGPVGNLIWNGYLHVAPQATGTPITLNGVETTVSRAIPTWAIPPESSVVWTQRTFLHPDWIWPVVLLVIGAVLDKISQITGGYTLFRLTSDVEKLPFPMAPVHAAGATALAEAGTGKESWRWNVFSTGAVVGLIFGFFYLGVPIYTGTVFPDPIRLIPLPFWDLTRNTEGAFPGAATGLSFDLTHVLAGFVLPLPMLIGSAATSVAAQVVVNPILFQNGMLPTYRRGAQAVWTKMATDLDFWMSIDIGLKLSVALLGLWMALGILGRYFKGRRQGTSVAGPPAGRGDFDWRVALGLFLGCQAAYVGLGSFLVPGFPVLVLVGLAFVYTPLISYVSARMYGLTGQGVGLPYLREAIFIRSGHRGLDVWFMPTPMHDYGYFAQRFREVELTGTKFSSIVRAERFVLPLVLVASFLYWGFLWYTSAIPSSQFPYAQMFWPVHVTTRVLWMSATTEGGRAVQQFTEAIRPGAIAVSAVGGLAAYGAMSALKLPVLLFYGAVNGVGQMMHITLPQLAGGLLGRYYFQKRFGLTDWRRYAPVLLAGFACGMGLIAMVAIALGIISKSVSFLPF